MLPGLQHIKVIQQSLRDAAQRTYVDIDRMSFEKPSEMHNLLPVNEFFESEVGSTQGG